MKVPPSGNHVRPSFPLRVISHNIRACGLSILPGEKPWDNRKPRLLNELIFNTTGHPEAFICCQEVLKIQIDDLLLGLNSTESKWSYIGVGRDDGEQGGEYSPIFYQPGSWHLLQSYTVWLSLTPTVPSKGWDAASPRIVTVCRFQHVKSGHCLVLLNTHLDDQGATARAEAVKIIANLAEVEQGAIEQIEVPVIVAGDFNSEPHQEAYQFMTKKGRFVDTFGLVSAHRRYGNTNTYTGFSPNDGAPSRIDFVFMRREDRDSWRATVQNYAVLENRFDDGVHSSDHRAVVVDLMLPYL